MSLGGEWDAQTRLAIETLAAAHPEVQPMLDEPSRWPADVAALLARNEEALGFVLAYPSLIDAAPPARVEEAVRGSFPTLLQWDARWGCTPYGGSILAITGCGPTALSVVVCGLTGDASLTSAGGVITGAAVATGCCIIGAATGVAGMACCTGATAGACTG